MKTSALSKFLNLLLEESDYRKTSYFAEKLMVSNKTISNYITELRYHMKEYELDITAKHGVGKAASKVYPENCRRQPYK